MSHRTPRWFRRNQPKPEPAMGPQYQPTRETWIRDIYEAEAARLSLVYGSRVTADEVEASWHLFATNETLVVTQVKAFLSRPATAATRPR